MEQLLTSHGETYMAGMDVRCVNVSVTQDDVKNLHNFTSSAAFMYTLKSNTAKYYGTAGIEYIRKLIDVLKNRNLTKEYLAIYNMLQPSSIDISTKYIIERAGLKTSEVDPQVYRVAERMALIATAGSIARKFHILPDDIDVINSCIDAFNSWIKMRGGTTSHEERKIIETTKNFILSNSDSLFYSIDEEGKRIGQTYNEVIGFKLNNDGRLNYYIFPGAMEKRAWDGMNIDSVLSVLNAAGYIVELSEHEKGRRYYQRKKTIPLRGTRAWVYCMSIPDDEDGNMEDGE